MEAHEATAIAMKIADDILRDLNQRSGLQNALDEVDGDIKADMRDHWVKMIVKRISQ